MVRVVHCWRRYWVCSLRWVGGGEDLVRGWSPVLDLVQLLASEVADAALRVEGRQRPVSALGGGLFALGEQEEGRRLRV